jgi:hypothetical protein
MWYYKQTEPQLWTVGHGEGKDWTTDSDHDSQDSAARRVAYLNGGRPSLLSEVQPLLAEIIELSALSNMAASDSPLGKLTVIFCKAVRAETLLRLS